MRVAYCGNFGPPHSTENHIARALENNGHQVCCYQEGEPWPSAELIPTFDVIFWTRTKSLAVPFAESYQALLTAERAGVPTVSLHLDAWVGLERQREILDDPFFRVKALFTADGGHDEFWAANNITHRWMPPGVSKAECEPGMYRSDLASEIGFVGSWQGGYHHESNHRAQLVSWLRDNYGERVAFWPKLGQPAVRGAELRDLYASVDVLVGDSCFTGSGLTNYWSDRIPESLGRGGFLLHPHVEGMLGQGFNSATMGTWTAFDWDALRTQIDYYLATPHERKAIAANGRALVLERHTYEIRMGQVIDELRSMGLLKPEPIAGSPKPVKKAPAKRAAPKTTTKKETT